MKPRPFLKRHWPHLSVLVLLCAALPFSGGCDGSYFNLGPGANQSVIPILFGSDIWNICVPNSIPGGGPYTRYTIAVAADGSTHELDDDSSASRSDCDFSVGTSDDVDAAARQASQALITGGPLTGGTRQQAQQATTTSGPHLVQALPYVRDVPFLPSFTTALALAVPGTCDPNGSFYAVNHTAATVTHFSSCTLSALATIPVFGHPLHPAITPDGSMLLVTSNDGAVNFISTATDTVLNMLQTPNFNPSGIDISPDGKTAYVTAYDGAGPILVIDIPSQSITSEIELGPDFPKSIVLTPDGQQAWVNFYANSVIYVLDLATRTIAGTINAGGTVSTGMAFNATGTTAYIAVQPSDLEIYNTANLSKIADLQVGAYPVDVTLSPDNARIYVTSYMSPTITIVDAHTNTILTTVQSPSADQRAFTFAPVLP